MTNILMAGLMLGAMAGGPVATLDHAVRLDHRSGPVDARYRGQVTVAHRQVGAVAPGGRPSTLRCVWSAGLAVDREARTASGALTTRRIVQDGAIGGSRPGWCATSKAAISREVAARMDRVHQSLQALAQEDHEVLRGELDRLHEPVRAGVIRHATIAAAALFATPAAAQTIPVIGVEAATDEARRGLSWSEGRASASADVAAGIGAIDVSARLVALRGSARHAGADAVADLAVASGWDVGAIRLRANATAHLFAGARGGMDYVELGGSAGYAYGPVQFTAGAIVAPSQAAIGGSNLYLYAGATAGVPGTPLTILADIGHSSGSVDDPVRAQRLRPGGSYADWRLGVEHRQGPITLGLDYVGTDVARRAAFGPFADARHAGDRIVGRARFEF